MTHWQVLGVHNGDSVYWNDPDEGICSRMLTVQTIEINDESGDDPVVTIMEPDGSVVECFASELS